MTLANSVMAQVELNKPLPEFGSLLSSNDDIPSPTDEIAEGTNRQNDEGSSPSDISNYEEFQNCLSDSIGEKSEVSESRQIVKDCFDSSYAENSVLIKSPRDVPGDDDKQDEDLPLLH